MSTRSQIGFYRAGEKDFNKFEALLYRHSDGYPSRVLPDILPFLIWRRKTIGIDIEYCSARLLQYLCNIYDKERKVFAKKMGYKYEFRAFTGIYNYGISKDFRFDIEYFYKIYPDFIEVYDVFQEESFRKWGLIWSFDLEKGNLEQFLKKVKERK